MAFCQYCGTKLEDGTECACEAAVKARGEVSGDSGAPAEPVTAQGTPTESIEPAAPSAPEAPVEPAAPAAPAPAMAPEVEAPAPVAAPSSQGQVSETAKATANEVAETFKAFVKDPMAVTSSEKDMGLFAALTLLALQALCFTFLVWILTSDLREGLAELSKYSKDYSYSNFGTFIQLLISSLLNSAVIFGLLFACAKMFKSNGDYKKVLSTVSLASIPWSVLWLLFIIVKFIVSKPSQGLIAIITALTIFIMVASICLLFEGIAKSIKNGYMRMLSVSLTYGVGVPLYFWILYKFFEKSPLISEFTGVFSSSLF